MSGRDAYAKRPRADDEPQRRTQQHRLSIDTRWHWLGGKDLKGGCAPRTPRRRLRVRRVENKDAQQAAVERRPAAETRTVHHRQRIRVVRHQHDGELSMLTPGIVDEAQCRRLRTRAKHPFCRLHEGAHLGVAIGRLADRFTVDPERDIVQKHAAVHLGQVDPALYTVAQQLVLHRIGLRAGDFLGLPVTKSDRPILYFAMDRPRQAARSFRRMVAESDRQRLNSQLVVWRGPLPVDPTRGKDQFADFAEEICPNVGTIIVDSVKDFAPGLSDDKVGSALNLSWQEVIARDIQLMLLHHERKAPNGVKRVHSLDDVYGSTLLTSGLGSVIVLDGEPGDPTVELRHLKQPAEPVGPLTLRHDHSVGRTVLFESRPDLLELLITAGASGVNAEEAALAIMGRATDNDRKTIRRQLATLVTSGMARKETGKRSGHGSEGDRWYATPQATWSQRENL